jgi:hypothetical protein
VIRDDLRQRENLISQINHEFRHFPERENLANRELRVITIFSYQFQLITRIKQESEHFSATNFARNAKTISYHPLKKFSSLRGIS